MIFEDDLEILKQEEEAGQKAIDSYSNLDFAKSPKPPSKAKAAPSGDEEAAAEVQPASTQLRQNEEDNLKSGDVTEDNHGKKFVSDDDDFFEPPPPEKAKTIVMMDAQHELLLEDYDDHTWNDGSTATMETYEPYDEDYKESVTSYSAQDEMSYEDEFTNYTYDVTRMY